MNLFCWIPFLGGFHFRCLVAQKNRHTERLLHWSAFRYVAVSFLAVFTVAHALASILCLSLSLSHSLSLHSLLLFFRQDFGRYPIQIFAFGCCLHVFKLYFNKEKVSSCEFRFSLKKTFARVEMKQKRNHNAKVPEKFAYSL